VLIEAAAVKCVDISGVAATSAVGSLTAEPTGEGALHTGVESPAQVGTLQGNITVDISGVEATPEVGTVTAT